jgi:uncharacterized protein YoxC
MADKNTKIILIVIALALIGILGVLVLNATKKTPEEKIADSVSETVEDIGNAVSGTGN